MKRKIAVFTLISLLLMVPVLVAATVYHGNVDTKIFHAPDCRYYKCKKCTANFNSVAEAKKAGYKPCKVCNPN